MRESLVWLTSHFLRLRVNSSSGDSAGISSGGLYPVWSAYAMFIGRLLVYLVSSLVNTAASDAQLFTTPAASPRPDNDPEHGLYLCFITSSAILLYCSAFTICF